MEGKLENEIQSYHIMDNPKYQNAKIIIDTIKEAYKVKIEKEEQMMKAKVRDRKHQDTVEQLLDNF